MFNVGSEKSIVAHYGALIVTALTTLSVFFAPASTAGHIIVGVISLITTIGVALGVYITPNQPTQVVRKIGNPTPGPSGVRVG